MASTKRAAHVASSSTSSSSTTRRTYQVFLSYRGEDTRKGITGHLQKAFSDNGINAFIDDEGLERGEFIKEQLEQAIQGSMISIIVFSKKYADSSWCLDELAKIMDCIKKPGHMVLPLSYHVDPTEVRRQKGCFAQAFQKHEARVLEGKLQEERVQRWRKALTDAANLSGEDLKNTDRGHEAKFIEKIIGEINKRLHHKHSLDIECPVGVDSRVKDLSGHLEIGSKDVRMVGILGMGGIGKTALAKAIFNECGASFKGRRSFLANVREVIAYQPINGLVGLQEQLLKDILKSKGTIKVGSVDQGIRMIKDRLKYQKALVVIDDVDQVEQLKSMAGSPDWFGPGSRIIITTRNEHVLNQFAVNYIYRAQEMDEKEALEFFIWHAFKSGSPDEEYHELSRIIVSYCGGLPLALKVLGSFLLGRSIAQWKSELEKLKGIPHEQILKKLKISYDGLDDHKQKAIFLDISCFFIGMDKNYVTKILDGCNFNAEIGISVLQQRCLVTVNENNMLMMHDLLRDLGREIVSAECRDHPERRSRLWQHEDVTDVLKNKSGTNETQALSLNSQISNKESFSAQAFANMRKLRLLQLNYVELTGGYEHLCTTKLRWLCWHGFPLPSIPDDFDLEILVAMDMQYSKLIRVWENSKLLEKLKLINLSHSPDLRKSPDFSEVPNLEKLILEDCQSLSEVHSSVGYLERLALVNLVDCKMLKDLPREFYNSKSLETLLLNGCSSFGNLAAGIGNIVSLTTLKADNTAIRQIPSSIVKLKNLQTLSLEGVKGSLSTQLLPSSLHGLNSLLFLNLSDCNLIDGAIPEDLESLLSLEILCLDRNNFHRLQSLRGLSKLAELSFNDCINLQEIPDLPRNLEVLQAIGCIALETIPDFSEMSNMRELYLSDSPKLTDIPGLDKSLSSMTTIHMEGCTSLTTDFRKKILQGWTSCGYGGIFLDGDYIPEWFKFVDGDQLQRVVSQSVGHDLKGLTLCCVYSSNSKRLGDIYISVSNRTRGTSSYAWITYSSGISFCEREDNYVWQGQLSNNVLKLQSGDDIVISVGAEDDLVKVKKIGVNLVWDKFMKENMHDWDGTYDFSSNSDWLLNSDDETRPSHDASDPSNQMRSADEPLALDCDPVAQDSKDDEDEDKDDSSKSVPVRRKEMVSQDLNELPSQRFAFQEAVLVRPSFELFGNTISLIPNEQDQEKADASLSQLSIGSTSGFFPEREIQPQEGHRTDDQSYIHIGTQDKVVNQDAAANDNSNQLNVHSITFQDNRISLKMPTINFLEEKGTSIMNTSSSPNILKRKRWESISGYQESLEADSELKVGSLSRTHSETKMQVEDGEIESAKLFLQDLKSQSQQLIKDIRPVKSALTTLKDAGLMDDSIYEVLIDDLDTYRTLQHSIGDETAAFTGASDQLEQWKKKKKSLADKKSKVISTRNKVKSLVAEVEDLKAKLAATTEELTKAEHELSGEEEDFEKLLVETRDLGAKEEGLTATVKREKKLNNKLVIRSKQIVDSIPYQILDSSFQFPENFAFHL